VLTNANAKTMLDLTGTNSGDGAAHAYSAHSDTIPSDDFANNTIAVGRLANGTDGELITWSTSGIATTVPAGTDTHVLTSNGPDTVPTFQVAPSAPIPKADTITIEDPVSGDVILFGRTDRALTIDTVYAVIDSGTSVVVSILSGTSRASADQINVNTQTASSTTTGTSLTISATNFDGTDWRWVTIGTVTGSVDSICITISYS
jgi:hypothetical protein